MIKFYCLFLLLSCSSISSIAQVFYDAKVHTALSPITEKKARNHQKLLQNLEKTNTSPKRILNAQINAVIFYTQHRDLKSQGDSLLKVIFSNKDLNNDQRLFSKAITTRGVAEHHNGEYEKAIQSQYDAISIREKMQDSTISYNYHLIAHNLMAIENFDEALKNYLKAMQLRAIRKSPNPKLTQRLAYAYQMVGDLENAEKFFLKSISEAQIIKSKVIEGTSMERLAVLYSAQGQYQIAIDMLEKSLVKRDNRMHIAHKITAAHALAYNHLALGDTKIARFNANNALALAIQINNHNFQQRLLRTIVNIDIKEEKKDSALLHFESLLTARDSFYNIENTRKFNELYTTLELADKEREILKKEVIIQQEGKTRNRLYVIIGMLSLLGVMGGLLIRNKISHEKKITAQNIIIKAALGEKEILLKEIHHRVKNNLQIVSSLLGMQSLSIKDESVKLAIDEGRARVHSMSLIHQNLYKKEKLTGIEMGPYLSQLCTDLMNTYHFENKEISLNINISKELWLDVETVVPLGLIINELITNSLKHAFRNQKQGTISVDLRIENKLLVLKVQDDGIGIIESDIPMNTFGHSLINAFKDKLDAELIIDSSNGTLITLKIKSFSTV